MFDDYSQFRFALYVRKSNEDKGKQILSIESQTNEMKAFAAEYKINIVKVYKDEGSAHKINNRKGFIDLLNDVQTGKIDGILAWKADRLARNMVEGGSIIHLLQNNVLKVIQTRYSRFLPTDNMLSLTVELGMANQFSLDLSKNIRRGNKTKFEKGGHNGVAPHGYLNDRINRTIIPDPERFHLVRKIWDLYLTENYSFREIAEISDKKWGYITYKHKTQGGLKLRTSTIEKILKNPMYMGKVRRLGQLREGNHQPMVTEKEFETVQYIMKRRGVSQPVSQDFAFTGQISCGECGCSITAEEKVKYSCPGCRKQLSSKNPNQCRRCGYRITKEIIADGNWYIYYRCTKKKGKCSQKYISESNLQQQILNFLEEINIDPEFEAWVIKWLKYLHNENSKRDTEELKYFQNKRESTQNKLNRLFDMKLDGEFDGKEEDYFEKKKQLEKELEHWEGKISDNKSGSDEWIKKAEDYLSFVKGISLKIKNGSIKEKKYILSKIGSNLQLKDRKLSLELEKPFCYFKELRKDKNHRLEPPETYIRTHKKLSLTDSLPSWYTTLVTTREYFINLTDNINLSGLRFLNSSMAA